MTRITNNDQILALVRNQLQRLSRRSKPRRNERVGEPQAQMLSRQERLRALSNIEDLPDQEFAEGFVRVVLREEFGEAISGSAGFQLIVERAAQMLQTNRELANLLREARK